MNRRFTFFLLGLLGVFQPLAAEIQLPDLFGDGAVLQRDMTVPVWGGANVGELVTVMHRGQTVEVRTDRNGVWRAMLAPMAGSDQPADFVVKGEHGERIVRRDLLVGDVWLCAGQSNMKRTVDYALNAEAEMAAANYPLIRHFRVNHRSLLDPSETASGRWVLGRPGSVGRFTAVGYFFAREVYRELGIPIGLINNAVGGTPVEAWMSEQALLSDPDFAVVFKRWGQRVANYPREVVAAIRSGEKVEAMFGTEHRQRPTGLFNSGVSPLIPFALRGVLWYQGEGNGRLGGEYHKLFATMISDWRARWGRQELPFLFVQLPNYDLPTDDSGRDWASLREAQTETLRLPHTAMAVTIDLGNPEDIHPRNKQDVGHRLALLALNQVYGISMPDSGPVPARAVRQGATVRVIFEQANPSLKMRGERLRGFEISDSDGVFHEGHARIEGDEVVVHSPAVSRPAVVRYAWFNNPPASLFNSAELPARPFRLLVTDPGPE